MGRTPCCDKVGLKRGPWTPEEDRILVSFIENYGHSNWRALPKQAGLFKCGKSCRLRWINYLKPDIKRANFSKEEEDTIIQLHEMIGNRWSVIASKLPGRIDNEIKNVWHTHLKKSLNKQNRTIVTKKNRNLTGANCFSETSVTTSAQASHSSQLSYSRDDVSSITDSTSTGPLSKTCSTIDAQKNDAKEFELNELPNIDETFWSSEEFSNDDINMDFVFHDINEDEKILRTSQNLSTTYIENGPINGGDSLDFWLDVFVRAGGSPELPEF